MAKNVTKYKFFMLAAETLFRFSKSKQRTIDSFLLKAHYFGSSEIAI